MCGGGCGGSIPACRQVGMLGDSYFGGDNDAKEALLAILESDSLRGDAMATPEELQILAACYLLDDRGLELSGDDQKKLEVWKTDHPDLLSEAERMVAEKSN